MDIRHAATAIVPSNDLDRSEAFYNRLGFKQPDGERPEWISEYRILHDAKGASIHLTRAVPGWVVAGHNPFGIYLYTEDVDALAAVMHDAIIEQRKSPEDKPWGMYEFAVSDPDGALVRIGWPTRLRQGS